MCPVPTLNHRCAAFFLRAAPTMTFAWYGHLTFENRPLWAVILVSWLIALAEY